MPEVTRRPTYHWTDDVDAEESASKDSSDRGRGGGGRVAQHKMKADKKAAEAPAEAKPSRPAPPPSNGVVGGMAPGADFGGATGAPAPRMQREMQEDEGDYYQPPTTTTAPRTNRPGLGTEFGESRYSAASYTKFVRNAGRPIAIAELRYNDVTGLAALGIPVQPAPDEGEIMLRETADPFPGDHHFSRPPGR